MGIYYGQRENLCPKCGGKVGTTFISVTPMSFYQMCSGCKTTEFTEEEEKQLGNNGLVTQWSEWRTLNPLVEGSNPSRLTK